MDVVFPQIDYLDLLPDYDWTLTDFHDLDENMEDASYLLPLDLGSQPFDDVATYRKHEQIEGFTATDSSLWEEFNPFGSTATPYDTVPSNLYQHELPRIELHLEQWLTFWDECLKSDSGISPSSLSVNKTTSSGCNAGHTFDCSEITGRSNCSTPGFEASIYAERRHIAAPSTSTLDSSSSHDTPRSKSPQPSCFPCDFSYNKQYCNSVFTNIEDLRSHNDLLNRRAHHCLQPNCNKSFTRAWALGRHIRTVHGNTPAIRCAHPKCSNSEQTFARPDILQRHWRNFHA